MLAAMLDGVGHGEAVEHISQSKTVVHHRRSLTDEEMCSLSAEWLAISRRATNSARTR